MSCSRHSRRQSRLAPTQQPNTSAILCTYASPNNPKHCPQIAFSNNLRSRNGKLTTYNIREAIRAARIRCTSTEPTGSPLIVSDAAKPLKIKEPCPHGGKGSAGLTPEELLILQPAGGDWVQGRIRDGNSTSANRVGEELARFFAEGFALVCLHALKQ